MTPLDKAVTGVVLIAGGVVGLPDWTGPVQLVAVVVGVGLLLAGVAGLLRGER